MVLRLKYLPNVTRGLLEVTKDQYQSVRDIVKLINGGRRRIYLEFKHTNVFRTLNLLFYTNYNMFKSVLGIILSIISMYNIL